MIQKYVSSQILPIVFGCFFVLKPYPIAMKKLLLLLPLFYSFISCNDSPTISKENIAIKDTLVYIPTPPSGKIVPPAPPVVPQPSSKLITFTKEIEKMNWVDDTARLHQVAIYPQLPREQVLFFEEQAFYPIPFEQSKIYRFYHTGYGRDTTLIDLKILSQATNIWGYFYRKIPVETWNTDGVIEQWAFPDTTLAQKAYEMISDRKVASMLYFNIRPYFTRVENSLYIFHARASAFSYHQKEVFELFTSN